MSAWLVLLVGVPAVTGAALALVGAARSPAREVEGRGLATLSLAAAAVTVMLAVVVAVLRPSLAWAFLPDAGFVLGVNGLSALLLPVVAGVALLVLAVAAAERTAPAARFHGLMLLFVAAVMTTLTAMTLPALLLGWEVMGAASWALIGFEWREATRTTAGVIAFVTTRTADLGLYLAAGAALAGSAAAGRAATLDLGGLPALSSPWREVVAAGLVVAAAGKAAQLPFSFWLSKAMLGPSPVSALLHSAAMVAMGGYLLLQVVPLLAATPAVAAVTAWVGALTTVAMGLVAMAQRDLKQLLAASTAAQLGFVVLAAGVGDVAAGAAHLAGHAATKALLFLVAGLWLNALGTKRLDLLGGVARWWRAVGVLFTLGALTLAGLPPLGLWVTKDEVLAAAAQHSVWLYGVGLVGAVLSAGYAAAAVRAVWRGPDRRPDDRLGWDRERQGVRHVPGSSVPPLVLLGLGALLPITLLVPAVSDVVDRLLAPAGSVAVGAAAMALSAGLALAAFALALRRVPRAVPGAGQWWFLERAAEGMVGRPVLALAARADRLDRSLDRAVAATARSVLVVATRAGRFDVSVVDGGVRRVVSSTRSLARTALRPQTGLVHQYLAAAVVLLTLGAVLLVIVRP